MHARPAPAADVRHYQLYGLNIRSELPLDGALTAASGPIDVEIRYGPVTSASGAPVGYHVVDEGTVLTIPDVARFLIANGRAITVDSHPRASMRNLRVYALGSAMGAILHQRGLTPLHANAVALGGAAVAFTGASGAGKSTLAAWFLDRGRAVLTDDVCVISTDAAGAAVAHRGLVRLRLWREALDHAGRIVNETARSFDDQDKFDVPTPETLLAPAWLPLGAIVHLRRASDDAFAIRRLHGAEAVDVLMANIYRGGYARQSGRSTPLAQACIAIARRTPVLEITRVWGFARYDEQALLVERAVAEHMAEALPAPRPLGGKW